MQNKPPLGWQLISVEDCMETIIDYRGKSPVKTTFGIPLITAKIVKGGRIDKPDEFIAAEDYDTWMRRGLPKSGDVVITTEAPLGEVAQLDGVKVALAQRLIALRGKDKLLDNTYLKFVMQFDFVQEQLRSRATGTTVLGIRQSELRNVMLPIPPYIEQRRIARILGTLDDKIELNRRMNETLEAMARTLFRSWFVDFDPVRAKAEGRKPHGMDAETAALFPDTFEDSPLGKIPKGWRVGTIAALADTNAWTLGNRDLLSQLDYVEIGEVSRGEVGKVARYDRGTEPSRARRRIRHGDTILSTVRPDRGAYFLAVNPPESLIVSTGFAVLTPRSPHWAFLHSVVMQEEFGIELGRLADGGAYPAVRPEVIEMQAIVIPNVETQKAYHNATENLFLAAAGNRKQSCTLAAIRDALLPKLLSGEIGVNEADCIAGEAG